MGFHKWIQHLGAILRYHQCFANGDTAVLDWPSDYMFEITMQKIVKESLHFIQTEIWPTWDNTILHLAIET